MQPTPDARQGDDALALRLARGVSALRLQDAGPDAARKAATCLFDLIGCAIEAADKAPSRQALAAVTLLPAGQAGSAALIGHGLRSTPADAAFSNAVAGHGLVREDMHAASVSHLGVAVLPAVQALADAGASQGLRLSGHTLLAAVLAGYEVGAAIGRALIDAELARVRRPTGITGPLAAAAAAARLLGLDAEQTAHALALAANTTGGLNQWGHTGGSEMYFHPGFAARSGLTAALLARAGAYASPTALDGEAGLFASLGRRDAAAALRLFGGAPEILAVYHKPVPACNFAQTASQAALRLAASGEVAHEQIAAVAIDVPSAAARYPGCDAGGPFERELQAKMSIPFNVAAALVRGRIDEGSFVRLDDPRVQRLLALTTLRIDDTMSAAFPARQAAAVTVQLAGGAVHRRQLDDVVPASAEEVRQRCHAAAAQRLGPAAAARIADAIDALAADARGDAAGALSAALAAPPRPMAEGSSAR